MSILELSDSQSEKLRDVVYNAWQHAASVYLSWIDDEPTLERLGMSYERYCSHRDDLARDAHELADLYEVVKRNCTPIHNIGV